MYSPNLQPLELFYEGCMSLSITNNGHSVQVDFNDSDDRTGKWPLPKPDKEALPLISCGKAWSSASASHCIKWSNKIYSLGA